MAWSDRQYAQEGPLYGASRKSATFWLIAITVGVQVLIWLIGGGANGIGTHRVNQWFRLEWSQLFGFQIWRYLSYLFLHGGIGHLMWNMVFLYFMGRTLEPHFGRKRFVILYLSLGAFSALGFPIHELFYDPPHGSVIGASGAIMGLLGFFGSRFPRSEVRLLFVPVTFKAAMVVGVFIGLDVLRLIAYPEGTGTAVGVHLAGAAGGVLYGFFGARVELMFDAARHQREQKKARKEADLRLSENQEMDRILAKISEQGMGELTEEERDFLRRQSERLKSRS